MSKREIVMSEAVKLFREKGYAATSMKDIAAAVGIEPAGLYNHIKSKEELLTEACLGMADYYLSHLAFIEKLEATPLAKIKALMRLHIRFITEHPGLTTISMQAHKSLPLKEGKAFVAARRKYENSFRGIVQEGMDLGEIREAPVEVVLNLILSSVRWIDGLYPPAGKASVEELEETVIETMVRGVKA